MAGLNIGDVFMKVLADMSGFSADVQKEAVKAGDKAGTTFGQRMKKGMSIGLTAVGTGAGVLFGVAARGAAELTDAMAAFQAETGATASELESARKSVLALSSTNIQSFDEIARAQGALRTQMGLTQDQAEAATESFLNFATATGQDASESVAAFDDILDSWGLTADNAGDIMDKLIVSHQKYGGVIADNEKTLAALAPSMKAANFEIDDGIALLNLFGAKGIDAMTASAAFSKALTKVTSPKELQKLIDDIAATEDPFQRASKAADLFGARAGAKLGNALAGADLEDYKVGMDEAAGATERASDAIENTPFNKLKMILRGIASPAIEAGQAFGPLILALSQLGGGKLVVAATGALGGLAGKLGSKLVSPLADAMDTAIAGVGKSSKVKGASDLLGRAVGTTTGKAFAIAFGLAAIVGVAALADQLKPQIDKFALDLHDQIFKGPLAEVGDALESGGDWLENLPWPLGPKGAPDWARTGAAAGAEATNVGRKVGAGVGTGIGKGVAASVGKGEDDVARASAAMAAPIPKEVQKASDKAILIGGRTPTDLAAAILERQGAVGGAMQALKAQMAAELTPWQQTVRTIGFLTSKEFGQGINDGRSGVRHLTEQLRQTGEEELRKYIASGGKIGKAAMDALNKGLKDKNPAVRAEARRIKTIIETASKPNTKPVGVAAGKGVVSGLNSQKGAVGTAAASLARTIFNRMLNSLELQAHRRGEREGKAGGGPVEPVRAAAGATTGSVPFAYQVNERGQELFVPAVRGRILTAHEARTIASARATPGGGGDVHVNLSTYGLPMRAETPLEVARQVRRVNSGILKPRQRRSWSAT